MSTPAAAEHPLVSYLTLRKVVGFLGVLFPIAMLVWGWFVYGKLLGSISDYHILPTGVVFAGVLWTIAWFLFAYRGYDRRDDRATDLACVLALIVSLAPNTAPGIVGKIHLASAAVLFLTFAYISYFLFTKSSGPMTPMKVLRNRVYRVCGVAIVLFIVLIALYKWLLEKRGVLASLEPVFWLETFCLWAFGVSWAVKGETILKDR